MTGMLRRKITKAAREIPIEVGRLAGRRYPAFVTARSPAPLQSEVPVFMFHSVDRATFEEQLRFLRHNDYQTLTLHGFMAFLNGSQHPPGPSVLLTFDDGDSTLFEVAFPLLQVYGFHAVAFVVPSYLRESPVPHGQKGWLAWEQVAEMDSSGIIDIQSHSQTHARIFARSSLVDFYHPRYNVEALGTSVPWVEENGDLTNNLAWGTPIHGHAPRLAGHPRYLDDIKVRHLCVEWVVSQGGEAFFQRRDWRRALTAYFHSVLDPRQEDRYESSSAQRQAMLVELQEARQVLEDRLHKSVRHFSYPWGAGCDLAVELSRQAGYASNFWVTRAGRRTNRPGGSPFYITRLKDDYLRRLPGDGRQPLYEVVQEKLKRRHTTLDIY